MFARPLLGAILLGILGVSVLWFTRGDHVPMFYGNGYPSIESLIDPNSYFTTEMHTSLRTAAPLMMGLVGLAAVKLVATSITVGSGGAGGLFAPSLLIGASTGGFIGYSVHALGWFPGTTPAIFALVGMAAMVAATTHAPLTAILIVYEVTQSYELILPLMFASVVSTVIARFVCKDSVYTFKLSRMGVRMGALSDLTILRRLTAEDVFINNATIVKPEDSVQQLVNLMETDGTSDFVVVDDHSKYCGMVTANDLRAALVYREAIPLLQVSELQRSDLPTVSIEETLDLVLDKFARSDVQALVMTNSKGEISGLITRSKLMKRYQKALDEDSSL
jgi:CIC family chloride channel protein